MKDKSPKDPAASIRARLLNHTRENDDNFQRILTRYAIERLLFRLGQTEASEQYVLKGAMLFITWPEHVLRPTGDLDLLGHGDPDPAAIAALFTRICQVEVPEDGIFFDPSTLSVEPVREADGYQGVRLRLKGSLARAIIPIQVDIGFGDHVYPAPERHILPSLLPDMPPPHLLMYPPETVVAEKFEAMIRFGEGNGRIKDFHDIWITTRTFPFELPELVEAVGRTLRRRGTEIPTGIPVGLTAAFAAIAAEKAFGPASCVELHRPWIRRRSQNCRKNSDASLAPSSAPLRCRKRQRAAGIQTARHGARALLGHWSRTPRLPDPAANILTQRRSGSIVLPAS